MVCLGDLCFLLYRDKLFLMCGVKLKFYWYMYHSMNYLTLYLYLSHSKNNLALYLFDLCHDKTSCLFH